MKHDDLRHLYGPLAALALVACSGDLTGGGLSDGHGAGSVIGGDGVGAGSQGASSQGASSQGGAGASSSGGNGQGAGSTGGSGQGGAGQGGSGQGGYAQGGNGTGAGSTGGNGTGAGATGGNGQGAGPMGGSGQGGGGPVDPYAAARTACINKINQLRATVGAPPYAQWTAAEQCADDQATMDEQTNTPHGSFGMCGEFGQNECLGAGVAGIENCLQNMWDERLQANCSGCDACAGAYDPNCPNCDFYGNNGPPCGHYVNMRALYFTMAACGFSALGGWDVIDFK